MADPEPTGRAPRLVHPFTGVQPFGETRDAEAARAPRAAAKRDRGAMAAGAAHRA